MIGYALITGATSGIGLELALNFARDQINLILISRHIDQLEKVKERILKDYDIEVVVIAKDLTHDGAPLEIYNEVKQKDLNVDYLINNAGFGTFGRFKDIDVDTEKDLVKLNVMSLLEMNKRFVPDMVERQFGYIMNVASMASFLPGPIMANYYASKAYVLSLSEAMYEELKEEGIKVSALCPVPVRTNFQETAKMKKSENLKSFMLEAKKVADVGYLGLWRGKAVVVPGTLQKALPVLVKLMPRCLVRKISMRSQDES
ncbi:MAG: SDR family oxidoreductase [Clostridium sp.]|nr:SDR family oxidoreductase [Clostridium sp.]